MNLSKSFIVRGLAVLIAIGLLSACNSTSPITGQTEESGSVKGASEKAEIMLADTEIEAGSSSVTVNGSMATITAGGEYHITGSLEDGQIVVDAPEEDVEIILDGVQIHNATGPALYVRESKNTTVIVAADSELSDGTYDISEEADAPSAAIYSMSDLKLKSETGASLSVTGNTNDGIVSKDDLKIKDLTLEVTATDDTIRGKDSVTIEESELTLSAGGDAIKSDNEDDDEKGVVTIEDSSITLTAGDDGIHAVSIIDILSGSIDILGSYEGIESKKINIYDGEISVVSRDDALNVAEKATTTTNTGMPGRGGFDAVLEGGELNIYGGTITIDSGGDGFDSNGNATMSGGTLLVNGPTNNGNGPIDVNGSFDVSGGTIIAVGSSGMAETPSESSSQLALQVNFESMQEAGTPVALQDASGNEMFAFTPSKQFQSVTYSSEKLQEGETYTFMLAGDTYTTLTLSDTITRYGTSARMGGGMPMGDMTDRTPPGMTLPDDWESMTDEERQAYMEANRPQRTFGDMNATQ